MDPGGWSAFKSVKKFKKKGVGIFGWKILLKKFNRTHSPNT
jgi:hypothetical protein